MSNLILKPARLALSVAVLSMCSVSSIAMTALNDEQLSEKSGQALLNLSTIMPGEQGNPNGQTGFYKVGLQAKLDLNANIRKLQLGCGGINGANGCDVDIDYLRFAGLGSLELGPPNENRPEVRGYSPVPNGGPGTDFELVNPYIELAFQNPDSLIDRKLVGMRVGGEQVRGVLSVGTRPTNADGTALGSPITLDDVLQEDASKHTGINSLTGSIGELIVYGVTDINVQVLGVNVPTFGTIKGRSDGNPDTLAPFVDVYSSRASQLRLAKLEVNDVLNALDVRADFLSDLKLIHNLRIADGDDFAQGFYISLSSLGDNLVDVKSNGNRTITRQAGAIVGVDDVVVNQPTNDTNWLKWQTTVNTNTTGDGSAPVYASDWVSAQRGWSLRVPRVEIVGFQTSKLNATLDSAGANGLAVVNNPDLGQVPIDNCFGSLSFC